MMDLLKEIAVVVDPAEFVSRKAGDGDKKRARARLNQISIEMTQLTDKINYIKRDVVRLEKKLEDKAKLYTPEAEKLLALLKEDSPDDQQPES